MHTQMKEHACEQMKEHAMLITTIPPHAGHQNHERHSPFLHNQLLHVEPIGRVFDGVCLLPTYWWYSSIVCQSLSSTSFSQFHPLPSLPASHYLPNIVTGIKPHHPVQPGYRFKLQNGTGTGDRLADVPVCINCIVRPWRQWHHHG